MTWGKMEMFHFSLIDRSFRDGQDHRFTWVWRSLSYRREGVVDVVGSRQETKGKEGAFVMLGLVSLACTYVQGGC